ncbi:Uncharacterized protein dnm_018100 [Desulfonema magnum]|uniref:Uncharacterized protein n=1 Tax=Desulfonema magnum TaxID=45655 RepID=A0A975BIM7_9BACT|nr:Uncharacterized protein dnm_018100 [Desulfonema magnum]
MKNSGLIFMLCCEWIGHDRLIKKLSGVPNLQFGRFSGIRNIAKL